MGDLFFLVLGFFENYEGSPGDIWQFDDIIVPGTPPPPDDDANDNVPLVWQRHYAIPQRLVGSHNRYEAAVSVDGQRRAKQKDDLVKMIKDDNFLLGIFECSFCDTTHRNIDHLLEHRAKAHPEAIFPFVCPFCGKGGGVGGDLTLINNHFVKHGVGLRNLICSIASEFHVNKSAASFTVWRFLNIQLGIENSVKPTIGYEQLYKNGVQIDD